MPVILHQFGGPGDLPPADPIRLVAKELARQCVEQYELQIMGPGGGIAGGSCWAAVALGPKAAGVPNTFPSTYGVAVAGPAGPPVALQFGIAFGNSQMAQVNAAAAAAPGGAGLPGFAGGGHAEQAAVNAGRSGLNPLYLLGAIDAVLFVQLCPCAYCHFWLRGPHNPYTEVSIGNVNLHVWYRWPYTLGPGGGVAQMTAWNNNAGGRGFRLGNIGAW